MKNFDINNHKLIYEILLGNFTVSLLGLILGYITAKISKCNSKETMFLCGIMSSPHTTSLPLILIEVLYPVLKNFRSGVATEAGLQSSSMTLDAKERGMLYIVLNSIFSNIWRWTVSYNLIQPNGKKKINYIEANQNSELEENLLEVNFKKVNRLNDVNNKKITDEDVIKTDNMVVEMNVKKPKKLGIWGIFKEIVNTPIIVSVISICLCVNDDVRNTFIAKNSLLADNLLSVNSIIARCYNFTVIFVLGLNFANLSVFNGDSNSIEDDDDEELFSSFRIFVISVMKLLIIPLIGCPLIYYYRSINYLTDDILIFLFMFMLAAPNAINIIIVCSVKRSWLKNISLIVIVTYISSMVTLTFAITLFLYILS